MHTTATTSQENTDNQLGSIVDELKSLQPSITNDRWTDTALSIPQLERQEDLRQQLVVLLNRQA